MAGSQKILVEIKSGGTQDRDLNKQWDEQVGANFVVEDENKSGIVFTNLLQESYKLAPTKEIEINPAKADLQKIQSEQRKKFEEHIAWFRCKKDHYRRKMKKSGGDGGYRSKFEKYHKRILEKEAMLKAWEEDQTKDFNEEKAAIALDRDEQKQLEAFNKERREGYIATLQDSLKKIREVEEKTLETMRKNLELRKDLIKQNQKTNKNLAIAKLNETFAQAKGEIDLNSQEKETVLHKELLKIR